MSKKIVFESSAFNDFNNWAKLNKKIYRKIVALIKDIDRSPWEHPTYATEYNYSVSETAFLP